MTEQSLLAHMQDNVSSSPILNSPQNPPLTAQQDAATTNDDVHLNNRIGTRKLVTNLKHHLGLRGRNFENRPTSLDVRRNRREIRVQAGPQTFNHRASNRISQPLQALNLLAEWLRESELRLTR